MDIFYSCPPKNWKHIWDNRRTYF